MVGSGELLSVGVLREEGTAVGVVEMWESRQRFPREVGNEGNRFWVSSFSIRPSFPPRSGVLLRDAAITRFASRSRPAFAVWRVASRWRLRYRTGHWRLFPVPPC